MIGESYIVYAFNISQHYKKYNIILREKNDTVMTVEEFEVSGRVYVYTLIRVLICRSTVGYARNLSTQIIFICVLRCPSFALQCMIKNGIFSKRDMVAYFFSLIHFLVERFPVNTLKLSHFTILL